MNSTPSDYRGIRLWGERLGSRDYYIEAEQERAVKDGAPIDALYKQQGARHWVCVRDLHPDHFFRRLYEETIKC